MNKDREQKKLLDVGNRLRISRTALGLSQKDLYQTLGVKAASWSHWESGKRMPDPIVMFDLYEKFGITMEWIYGGDIRGLPFSIAQTILKEAS
ncbi:helix-turn-helix transcriptional regulator [Terasakiella sp. SH-1]|uniref:helix-turn-helix domain-containing protein n=1 Tax=Terasakiella sp. SH-1 TaxID=2560057 RepID=UPI0010742499|nr:helix-turn-helix transcriptional regulator [Terasakiella sp. SH-1]